MEEKTRLERMNERRERREEVAGEEKKISLKEKEKVEKSFRRKLTDKRRK